MPVVPTQSQDDDKKKASAEVSHDRRPAKPDSEQETRDKHYAEDGVDETGEAPGPKKKDK